MKITDIEVIELRVPGWTGATFDGSYDNCIVLVHTDGGVTGIAEVDSVPSVIRAIIAAPRSHTHAMGLKEIVVGQDPLQVEAMWDRMYDWTSYYGRRGVVIHAMSAIDIALWDIRGKIEGKPVADLLGQRKRNRLLAYGTVYPLGETPDEVRTMSKGRFEIVRLGDITIGRATYAPGWKWSVDVGPGVGATHCTVEHVGMVLQGTATAAFEDGTVVELRAGCLFHIPDRPHDSWVVGNEPYVSLHFLGADHYAK